MREACHVVPDVELTTKQNDAFQWPTRAGCLIKFTVHQLVANQSANSPSRNPKGVFQRQKNKLSKLSLWIFEQAYKLRVNFLPG